MAAPVGALFVELRAGLARFQRDMQNATKPLRNFGKQAERAGRTLSLRVSAPAALAGAAILKAAGDFEAGMNQVSAVTGATGADIDKLREQAKQLGITTQFSASQAAEAMGFLGQAGLEANEILSVMPDTLSLAAASGMDLGETADLVTNVMSGFGRELDKISETVDVLVKGSTSANTTVRDLGEAMKFVGPVAATAGLRFNEVVAAAGLLGDVGIQGEMAGTALRGAIAKILNPTKEAAEKMAELGIQLTDSQGRIRPLAEVLQQLAPHAEDAGLFMELFGQRAGPGMAALVAKGSDELVRLTSELDNAGGTAGDVAAKKMEGFNGAMKALRSAVEGLLIAIGESGLLQDMTKLVNKISEWIREVADANPGLLNMIGKVTLLGAAIGPVIAVLGTIAIGIAALANPIGIAVAAIAGAGGLIATFALMKDDIIAFVRETVDFIQAWLVDKLNAIVERVGELVGNVTGFFEDMWREVVGESFVPAMVTAIGDWFGRLDQAMVQPAKAATKETARSFEDMASRSEAALSRMGRFSGGFAGPAPGTSGAGTAGPAAEAEVARVSDRMRELGNVSRDVGRTMSEALRLATREGASFKDILEQIEDSALGILENFIFGGGLGTVVGAPQAGQSGPGGIFSSFLQGFAGFFAKGGLIPSGQFGIVGERGPEPVFAGAGGARVLPSSAMSPGGDMAGRPIQLIIQNPQSVPEIRRNAPQLRGLVREMLDEANRRD